MTDSNSESKRATHLVNVHHNLRACKQLQDLQFFDPVVVYNDEEESADSESDA